MLQFLILDFIDFIGDVIIPFLFLIALVVFLVNAVRFFIIGGDNVVGQEKAKQLALWGLIAFVFLISLWGIINLLARSFNLDGEYPITPDYLEEGYYF